jgi:hypothetical protein
MITKPIETQFDKDLVPGLCGFTALSPAQQRLLRIKIERDDRGAA